MAKPVVKKVLGWGAAGIALLTIVGALNTPSTQQQNIQSLQPSSTDQSAPASTTEEQANNTAYQDEAQSNTADPSDSGLSNNDTYTNVNGNTVHSPAYSTDNSVPAGATAQCVDGTYSFSQHRSGTCSHHGGVASWL